MDVKNASVLFKINQCGEADEYTDVFNFTCKVGTQDVEVNLGHGTLPMNDGGLPPSSETPKYITARKRKEARLEERDREILNFMR